jgi:hypothetical protein
MGKFMDWWAISFTVSSSRSEASGITELIRLTKGLELIDLPSSTFWLEI